MKSLLDAIIDFFGDTSRQGAFTLIGGALIAIFSGGWAVFQHIRQRSDNDIRRGEIRLSIDDYDKRLRANAAEIKRSIQKSHGTEKAALERTLSELQKRIETSRSHMTRPNARLASLRERFRRSALTWHQIA